MTFTEAAVEVLRSVGKPLHYKKITEIAIEKNLLSHVGKTPETTMSSRLATMVKKDRGDAPIIKVKPGVFALRDSAEEAPDEAADTPPAEKSDEPEAVEAAEEATETAKDEAPAVAEEEPSIAAQDHPGADVFPEEDDDDELILANLDDDAEGKRSRRRRPRRRRERDADPSSTADTRSERRPPSRRRSRKEPEAPATRSAEAGEPVGRDLSDAIETTLRGRSRQPRSLQQVAEALIEGGRLSGSAATLAPTLSAAIRGDNAKRRATGGRPRFREGDGQVSLLEWALPNDAVNAERDAVRAADRQRHSVRRALIKRLKELPDGALLELLAAWLNAVGVHSLRAVRADAGDFNLAGTLRRGPEETPLAISIYKARVDKEAIVALRGGLHNFDHARIGWLITLGKAADGTSTEAHAEGAAPCAVFDGDALASSMEDVGVGLQRVSLPLAVLDIDLLDSLGGGASRSTSQASASDDNGDAAGNKRRRSRRRGRRRGPREDGADESAEEGSAETSEASSDSEPAGSEPAETETVSESAPEAAEDTEKKANDAAPEAAAEADQL